jgi:predicted amidohydrolase
MAVIRVSLFQKDLREGLTDSALKKISNQKADFVILPEYFACDQNVKDQTDLVKAEARSVEWLGRVSDANKGIVIGGSVIKHDAGKYYNASPILSGGHVVDWYRKRNLTDPEKKHGVTPGTEMGIFILAGFRFGMLICADVLKPEYFTELANEGVKLVFAVLSSPFRKESLEDKHKRDDELFSKPCRDYGMVIVKCCAAGALFGHPLQGRSLVASPTGISWRVAPQEEDQEILKTLIINV